MHEQVIVGEVVAGRAATVRRNLMTLVNSLHVNEFDLAELFYEAQENNYPAGWGFSSLAEYAKQELGLKERKAQYLAKVVKVCRAVGLERKHYEPAGKSKLREITTLDPEKSFWNSDTKVSEPMSDHIVRLVLDHDKLTVEQTRDEVLRLQGRTGADRPVHRTTTYPLSVWENVIKPARELARKKLGSASRDAEGNAVEYSDGACDEVIFADFLSDPNNIEEDVDVAEEKDMQDYVESEIKIPTEDI